MEALKLLFDSVRDKIDLNSYNDIFTNKAIDITIERENNSKLFLETKTEMKKD